jgi:hypothetical protein
MTKQNDDELVSLQSLPGIIYAEMVQKALEAEGIKSMIKSDVFSSVMQTKGANLSGDSCRIFVHQKDAVKAGEILHTMMDHF